MSFRNCGIVSVDTDAEKYHADKNSVPRGDGCFRMSPSSMKDFIHCASRWMKGHKSKSSDAKDFGSLLDVRWFTPKQFVSKYTIHPATYVNDDGEVKPFNANSTVCKKWLKENEGFEIVSAKEVQNVDAAIERLNSDKIIKSFYDACDKQVLIRGEWLDEDTGVVVPVECLVDLLSRPDSIWPKRMGDLKAIRSADRKAFRRQVYYLGWHVQAAFDLDLAIAATGRDLCDWMWVGVENYAPWEPFRRLNTEKFFEIGRSTYLRALKDYARCLSSGKWPSYDDLPKSHPESDGGVTLVMPEPWMEFEELSDQMESEQLARREYESSAEEAEPQEEIVDFQH